MGSKCKQGAPGPDGAALPPHSFVWFGKTAVTVLGKQLEGSAGTRLCGNPLLTTPCLAGPCRSPLLSTSGCSPLLQHPRPRSSGGAHGEPLCSAPPPAHSLGCMMGTGLAAEMPGAAVTWASQAAGTLSLTLALPAEPPNILQPLSRLGKMPGTHQGWRRVWSQGVPRAPELQPHRVPFPEQPTTIPTPVPAPVWDN